MCVCHVSNKRFFSRHYHCPCVEYCMSVIFIVKKAHKEKENKLEKGIFTINNQMNEFREKKKTKIYSRDILEERTKPGFEYSRYFVCPVIAAVG